MKRIVTLLVLALAVVLCVSVLSNDVYAADVVASGYCGGEGDGTNLSWSLDSDGVLNISGSSETGIVNQTFGEPVPLGSGVAVMLVAGAGYLFLKKKED